jgi:hypothetical protein
MIRMLSIFLAGFMLFVTAAPVAASGTASPALAKYTEQVDGAVERGLVWLARNQRKNGSFPGQYGETTAVAGLAGLAFLSKGHTPMGKPYGTQINRCIDYILANQQASGYLNSGRSDGRIYAHSIATLFLTQVSGMVGPERQKKVDKALAKAVKLLLNAQAIPKHPSHQGGWRYHPNSRDSDLSVSGWALMALRSARLNGAPVPKKAIDDAVAFVLRCHRRNGMFGYLPGGGHEGLGLSGIGLTALLLTGRHNHPTARRAGDYILAHIAHHKDIKDRWYHYATYYCAQGMYHLGGKHWDTFAKTMYTELLRRQLQDGSWRIGNQWSFSTAMAVLSLTVDHDQLPIHQR